MNNIYGKLAVEKIYRREMRKMVNEMNIFAYVRLLNRKITSAHNKAQNPFTDGSMSSNPFSRPLSNTLVWVEAEDELQHSQNAYLNK